MSLKATLKHPSGKEVGRKLSIILRSFQKMKFFKDNWICLSIFVYLLDNATGKCSII